MKSANKMLQKFKQDTLFFVHQIEDKKCFRCKQNIFQEKFDAITTARFLWWWGGGGMVLGWGHDGKALTPPSPRHADITFPQLRLRAIRRKSHIFAQLSATVQFICFIWWGRCSKIYTDLASNDTFSTICQIWNFVNMWSETALLYPPQGKQLS